MSVGRILGVAVLFSSLFHWAGDVMAESVKFDGRGWSLWPPGSEARFEVDEKAGRGGVPCGKITAPEKSSSFSAYTYVDVKGDRSYSVRLACRVEDPAALRGGQIQVHFNFNKAGGGNGSAGAEKTFWTPKPGGEWQEFATEMRTPPDAVKCQFTVGVETTAKTSVFLGLLTVSEVRDSFEVSKAAKPPVIDGRLDDECWLRAAPVVNFYSGDKNAAAARTGTEARITYDDENLYVAFVNHEPEMKKILAKEKGKDAPLWNDDCDEVFIRAPNGETLQFIVNSTGGSWDGRIFAKVPGDPYTSDSKWNGEWNYAPSTGKDSWTTEIRIPLSNFKTGALEGTKWGVNLARERKVEPELSHLNRVADSFNNVEKFASLEFSKDAAKLVRHSEKVMTEPFKVARPAPKFKELLTDKPGKYTTAVWSSDLALSCYPPALREKYTKETFAKEQENVVGEYARAGVVGSAFPWLPASLPVNTIKKFHDEQGMKFWMALFSSAQCKAAVERGAAYYSGEHAADPNDPKYQEVIRDLIKSYFEKNQSLVKYMSFVIGIDEPMNNTWLAYSATANNKHKDALSKVDAEIREKFGFGKFGRYDIDAKESEPEASPFAMIAFTRWWNATFAENTKIQKELLSKHAPGLPFISHNMNFVKGIGREDVSTLSLHTDIVSADPYPTSAMYNFGRSRALYHTGFSFKYIKDLSGGKPATGFVQAFPYCGRSPAPSDLREWASQSLKNGADGVNWFCVEAAPLRVMLPDVHKELLRICGVLKGMSKLAVPNETKTAVLFSNPSFLGSFDEAGHSWYSVYSILGENLKSWFRFVSDSGLRLKLDDLSRYSLVYVPELKYCEADTADALLKYVRNGGRLVIFDPEALAWNIDGSRLDNVRAELIGSPLGTAVKFKSLKAASGCPGLAPGDELALTPVAHRTGRGSVLAFSVAPPKDSKIIATYPDGSPAAFERKLGKGFVTFFAAQPFGNSDLAVEPGKWAAFMSGMAGVAGEKTGLPIWDFELPATGGEVEVKYELRP